MRTIIAIIASLLLIVSAFSSFAQGSQELAPSERPQALRAAGFAVQETREGFVFAHQVSGNNVRVFVEAPTTGWIATGFDPTNMMKDANIIIGYVRDGDPVIRDDFGLSIISHGPDSSVGGTDDVELVEWDESEGRTSFLFEIPLSTGTPGDRPLVPGRSYRVIWAFAPNGRDNFTAPHLRRGSIEITL